MDDMMSATSASQGDLVNRVARFIELHRLFPSGTVRLVVGLSGGADSVCLLCLLQELGYQLVCAHCNFHLRGEESDRDEAFVRQLCRTKGVELHVRHFDTQAFAHSQHISIEMAARQQRYDFFEELRQEVGVDAVCVAHHRDDNVETLLLNLLRGTGLQGLCAMQPRSGRHVVRPLLQTARADILAFLAQRGQPFVSDSTNASTQFSRNKIRLEVLPLLRSINPAADQNIATTIENLCEARSMYQYCVEEFAAASLDGPDSLDIASILRAPSPLSVLHNLLSPLGFQRSQLVDMLTAIHHTGRQFHSPTHTLLVDRQQLLIRERAPEASAAAAKENEAEWPFTVDYLARTADFTFDPSPLVAYFDADKLCANALSVRPAATGDRFVPFGMRGSKLVSDLLTDLKLSRFDKQHQLLLLSGDTIAWVIGRRTSNLFRVDEGTKTIVRLTWRDGGTERD